MRGIKINGVSSGSRFDQLKNELPQLTPWKEKIFKYSLNTTYSLSERLALSGKASIIKVSRDNYISNPNKKDYDSNQLLEIGLFFEVIFVDYIFFLFQTLECFCNSDLCNGSDNIIAISFSLWISIFILCLM